MADENPRWRRYLRFWGPDPATELDEEFRFHLETEIEALVGRGMPAHEARAMALARFGDVKEATADCLASDARRQRRLRRGQLLDVFRHDLRYAVRGLVMRPAFTATVVLTLALGVGANAAVFAIVDRVFLRAPLGVDDPTALRRVYTQDTRRPSFQPEWELSLPEALDIERAIGAAIPTTTYLQQPVTPVEPTSGVRRLVSTAWVTPSFFRVLGVRPAVGRDLTDDDFRLGTLPEAVIISWVFWRRELGGDRDALGRTIRVGGRPVTIVGIAPPGFTGIDIGATELWLPLSGYAGIVDGTDRWYENRGWSRWQTVARLPAEVAAEQLVARAQEALRAGMRAHRLAFPRDEQFGDTAVRALLGSIIAARGPRKLSHEMSIAVVLVGVAALVFVIAAANAGNLMLGRALHRRRETALRLALGIGPRRLVGQIVLESLLIAVASTVAAVIVAAWVAGALRGLLLPGIDWPDSPLDARIAIFAMLIAIVGGIAAGLVAVVETMRADAGIALKGSARDGGGRRSRTRASLLAVQAMLSLVLLVGTGLFARTLYNVRHIDLGHDLPGLITVAANDEAVAARFPAIADLARSLPGVIRVAGALEGPFDGRNGAGRLFTRDGDTITVLPRAEYMAVEPGYLTTVGTGIVRGRDLSAAETIGAPPAMVISEEIERRLWPGRSALGECIRFDRPDRPCYTIVGVAQNANGFWLLEEPSTVMYMTLGQRPRRPAEARALAIRVAGDPVPVIERLRIEVGDTIPGTSDRAVQRVEEILAPQYRPWELGAKLFAGFAVLALVLAGLGLYSVLAYLVTLRRHELGVRLALGATGGRVMRLVVGDGLRQVLAGIIAGVAIVAIGARALTPLLYEVSPGDPAVLVVAVAVLLLGAVIAALVPARRAVRVDPMIALREE